MDTTGVGGEGQATSLLPGPASGPASGPRPASGSLSARIGVIRSGGLWGLGEACLAMIYALATPDCAHRPVILAVAAAMVVFFGLIWWHAMAMARSRAQASLRQAGSLVCIVGCALFGLLDGGIAGPFGPLLPFTVICSALGTPPKAYVVLGAFAAAAYWGVELCGDPAPPGYAVLSTLGFAGLAYLCVRHAGVLVSLRHRLAEASRIDPLTKALNRRGFDERLTSEFAEARRTGDPLTLVLVDLDRFKEINDTYGHQAGDQLLAWTAGRLMENLRAHDAVGRVGGDEFALVLGGAGPEGAAAAVERLRASLDGVAPASIGYACFPADATTLVELERIADARVYQDKRAHERCLPPAAGVAAARGAVAPPAAALRVSGRERRRRSIADMGWVAVCNFSLAVVYAAAFARGSPHRQAIGLCAVTGCATATALILAARRLSRTTWARVFLLAYALVLAAIVGPMAAFGGTAGTVLGLGMVTPMPLIAFATPLRVATPILMLYSSLYVAVAVVVGAPSGWTVVMLLCNALAVSAVCAVQGRAAARQRRLLTRMSRIDVLTDVLNRSGFEERFKAEVAHARRTGRTVTLLIFDLDGFKQVNDVYGHAAGDELLCWVAATLTAGLRPHDVVGRLGGDEFVVLLTSNAASEPTAIVGRLRTMLAVRAEVSVGAATLGRHGADFPSLYAHADAMLYAEKSRRRSARHAAEPGATGSRSVPADDARSPGRPG